ncbi:MAG: hypothetical protein ABID83_05735 [Candidatus Omnitrophota bacterium]
MVSNFLRTRGRYLSYPVLFCFIALSFAGSVAFAETSDTVKDGIGGGLIGALAGSLGGYAGWGALIGGGIGLAGGAISDSSKDQEKQKRQQDLQDAYQKGIKDGGSVHYKEGEDRDHIDKFGENLKN